MPNFERLVEGVIHCAAERRPDVAEKVHRIIALLNDGVDIWHFPTGSRWHSKSPLEAFGTQVSSLMLLMQLNVGVPESLAHLSKRHGFTLIYISTGALCPYFA